MTTGYASSLFSDLFGTDSNPFEVEVGIRLQLRPLVRAFSLFYLTNGKDYFSM